MSRREFLEIILATSGYLIGCTTPLQYLSLSFTNDEENYIHLEDGEKIHFNKMSGDPNLPSVVYTHSFFIGHLLTELILSYFTNNPKIIWDLPGYGKSDSYKDKKYSMQRVASTLDRVIEATGVEKPIVAGHSFGSMVSFQYVADFPNKARSALIVNAHHKAPRMFEMEEFLRGIGGDIPNFFSYLGAMANYDLTTRLNEIKVPILLVNGTEDIFIPRREIDELVDLANFPVEDYRINRENHLFSPFGFSRLKQIIEQNFLFLYNQ